MSALRYSKNAVINRCAIGYFGESNEKDKMALIENSYIRRFIYGLGNSHDPDSAYKQPYAIYRNNILNLVKIYKSSTVSSISLTGPSEYYDNRFYSMHMYNYPCWDVFRTSGAIVSNNELINQTGVGDLPALDFKSEKNDSTVYGTAGHKEYPAIPSIESAEIDTETDEQGVLHVKIAAKARD